MSAPVSPYAPPSIAPTPPGNSRERAAPSPTVAALLSFFFRGAGHVYAGATKRGAAWAATTFATSAAWIAATHAPGRSLLVAMLGTGLALVALHLVAMNDASRTASGATGPRARGWFVAFAAFLFFCATEASTFVTRRFVVQAFKIPSGSMIPTLLIGDHLFVDKMRVGSRGDLIVFPFPEHSDEDFIKRVAATAGDRIEFEDSHPILNGVRVPSCRLGAWSYEDDLQHEGDLFVESIDGHAYLAFYDRTVPSYGHQGPWTVKPGEVFVIGDNRNNAHDSRMWYGGRGGGVPVATVSGVPFVVWLSVVDTGVDWSRVGARVGDPILPSSAASLAPELARCLDTLRAP